VVRDALAGRTKQLAIALELGVSVSRVQAWLDPEQSDRTPVPLAVLLEMDAEDFRAVIAAIGAARGKR
jgi:hypothetical protein